MNHAKSIVIVGGGFAGTTLARALGGRLPQEYELVLISEGSYTTIGDCALVINARDERFAPRRRSSRCARRARSRRICSPSCGAA